MSLYYHEPVPPHFLPFDYFRCLFHPTELHSVFVVGLHDVMHLAKNKVVKKYLQSKIKTRFSTGTFSFKLETDYNFCNEVKELCHPAF